ncbi:putative RNA-directed DNA polymerase, eukaryota, reverse transcriptase zinc-binding domain protein [Tanacetum coccineum]
MSETRPCFAKAFQRLDTVAPAGILVKKNEVVEDVRLASVAKQSPIDWFWDRGEISHGCNSSFISLIPKTNDPIGLKDFRPISLIGCFYKIIAKVLAERIKKVIDGVIGSALNAFIKGRFILDGVLVANEAVDYLRKSRGQGLIFKIDFEKAYDCVNWDYIRDVMMQIGFGLKWCNWVDACLRSASISILVNGSPTGEFRMTRGIRQGDPLSPFLFLIVAEGINVATKEAISNGVLKGVSVGRLPFVYLGLPIGLNMNRVESWNAIVEKFKEKLSFWKAKTLSFGGRLTLVRSVLNSRGTWSSIIKVGKEIDRLGIEFTSSFGRKLGNGESIRFWVDKWVGNYKLCDRFPRLFRLERNKEVHVGDRGCWDHIGWNWCWDWVANPRGRSLGELEDCISLVRDHVPSRDGTDSWQWMLEDGGFSVKVLKEMVDEKVLGPRSQVEETKWCRIVPRKVNVFMWRLKCGRIPVRTLLDNIGMDLHSTLCPHCEEAIETIDHSMVRCKIVCLVWSSMCAWWNIGSFVASSVQDVLNLAGFGPSKLRLYWEAVIWASLYLIWKARNNKVFRDKEIWCSRFNLHLSFGFRTGATVSSTLGSIGVTGLHL